MPTEAEWEYAARGGNKSQGYKYSGSNNIDDVGWCNSNSGKKTHPIGQKNPNELGLYDMSGNVWEWCSDYYDDHYYDDSPSNNPAGPSKGKEKVMRGGMYGFPSDYCRVYVRYNETPEDKSPFYGFRLAWD